MTVFSRFLKDESGATAIEYALIAAVVGLGLITALGLLGNEIGNAFNEIGNELKNQTGAGEGGGGGGGG